MMRILCVADIHDNYEHFSPLHAPDADLCLVAGDLTQTGRWQGNGQDALYEVGNWLKALSLRFPVLWIPGNHDIGFTAGDFEIPDRCFNLLDRGLIFAGLRFHGVAMTPAFDNPKLAKMWDFMTTDPTIDLAKFGFGPVDVILSHGPPLDCLDYVTNAFDPKSGLWEAVHVGSPGLRTYIETHQPRLVVCGHVHDQAGQATIGNTLIVNTALRWTLVEL